MPLSALSGSFGRLNGDRRRSPTPSARSPCSVSSRTAGGFAVANLLRDLGDGVDFDTAFEHRMQRSFADFQATLAVTVAELGTRLPAARLSDRLRRHRLAGCPEQRKSSARGRSRPRIAELKQLLGSRANDTAAVRDHHSHGESYHLPAPPDVVCFPHTTDEVAGDRRGSAPRIRLPIVPFGAGTSLEGHVHAIQGRHHDRPARDEPGRPRQRGRSRRDGRGGRHAAAARRRRSGNTGLMFPVDPGADCDDRRHGGHARLGHDGGALRHDARERARADGRPRRRPGSSGPARARESRRPATT